MRTLVACMLLGGSALIAADLGGTWMSEQAGRGGGQPNRTYYYFRVDGTAFTGQMVSTRDRRPIVNGKIDGETITFETKDFQDRANPMRGELKGDDLTITNLGGGRGRGGPLTFFAAEPGGPPPGAVGRGPDVPGRGPGGPGGGRGAPPALKKISADMKIPADLLPTHQP